MLATIIRKAWTLSLILKPFGVRQPGSLKIGEYNSLCEAEHASTFAKQSKDLFEEPQSGVLNSIAKKKNNHIRDPGDGIGRG